MALRGMASNSADSGSCAEDESACAPDRPDAEGAIRAGSGEDDADRGLSEAFGE